MITPSERKLDQRTEIAPASTMMWRQAALDFYRAGLLNDDRRPPALSWSQAAIGGGEVLRPMHADEVFTWFGQEDG